MHLVLKSMDEFSSGRLGKSAKASELRLFVEEMEVGKKA
jgi:hypothetical protein